MGASLAVFLLAILGRSAFPQKMDLWNDFLHKDINLNAALTRFEEATEQGEPFMDALGELCMEVFTAGESQSADQEQEMADNSGENMREYTAERAERWNAWEEFRESQWHSK